MKSDTRIISTTLRIPEDLLKQLTDFAEKDGTSNNYHVIKAIKAYLSR